MYLVVYRKLFLVFLFCVRRLSHAYHRWNEHQHEEQAECESPCLWKLHHKIYRDKESYDACEHEPCAQMCIFHYFTSATALVSSFIYLLFLDCQKSFSNTLWALVCSSWYPSYKEFFSIFFYENILFITFKADCLFFGKAAIPIFIWKQSPESVI